MQFLPLIYSNEAEFGALPEPELKTVMEDYGAFTQSIIDSGAFTAGDRLEWASAATTVRIRDGKTSITVGPFAETREQLGGYYVIEAKDRDEATAIAARIPGAKYGSIEVRPVFAAP